MLTIDTITIHKVTGRREWFATFHDGMLIPTPFLTDVPIDEVIEHIQSVNPDSSVIQKRGNFL